MIVTFLTALLLTSPPSCALYIFRGSDGAVFSTVSMPHRLEGASFRAVSSGDYTVSIHFDYSKESNCFVSSWVVICAPKIRAESPMYGEVIDGGRGRILFYDPQSRHADFSVWSERGLESFGVQEGLDGRVVWEYQRLDQNERCLTGRG